MSSKAATVGKIILLFLFVLILFAAYIALNVFIGVLLYDAWGIGGCIGGMLAITVLSSGGFSGKLDW